MRSSVQKATWLSLSLVSVCAILSALVVAYHHLELKLRVLFAREQVQIFAAMRERARAGDTQCAIACLQYTVEYYPSGTKQVDSSPLNEIVETSRRLTIEDIIALLRQKSGRDFGGDPMAWIRNREVFIQETGEVGRSSGEGTASPK